MDAYAVKDEFFILFLCQYSLLLLFSSSFYWLVFNWKEIAWFNN